MKTESRPNALLAGWAGVAVLLLAGTALTWLVYRTLVQNDRDLFEAEFQRRAQDRISVVQRDVEAAVVIVEDLSFSVAATGPPTVEGFRITTEKLVARHPFIQALGYNEYLTRDQRDAWEASGPDGARREIREVRPDGTLVRAGDRDDYVVVSLIEPLEGNRKALYFDVASDPTRRQAFEWARREGRTATTGRVTLVQDREEGYSVLIAAPVTKIPSGDEASLPGGDVDAFVVGVFRIPEIVEGALETLEPGGIDVYLTDLSAPPAQRSLYVHPSRHRGAGEPSSLSPESVGAATFQLEGTMEVGGRRWVVQCVPTEAYVASHSSSTPRWFLLGSFLLVALLVSYVRSSSRLTNDLRRAVSRLEDAQSALRAGEQRFRELVNDVDAIVWEADLGRRRFDFVSRYASQVLGFDPELWLGRDDFWESRLHPEDRDAVIEHTREKVGKGRDHEFEYRAFARNGSVVWIQEIVHVVCDAEGVPVKLRGLMIDTTARKTAEYEKMDLEAKLMQSQKMEAVGTLASGVAHDFNNALTAILGYTDLLEGQLAQDPSGREALRAVRTAANQASGVTRSLLTFSRTADSETIVGNLAKIVGESYDMLRRIVPASVEMTLTTESESVPWVRMDPTQIQQVILNLAVNARDAMLDGGRLGISVSTASDSVSGGQARIVVEDTGGGIASEIQDRIFEPFFTTKPRELGTGLGLYIVHRIVTRYGGSIEIDPNYTEGTRIIVALPLAEPEAEATTASERSAPLPEGAASIIVAEDNEQIRELMRKTLTGQGYSVTVAGDGAELTRVLKDAEGSAQLVILDVDLPKRSGLAALEEARRLGNNIPAIVISGLPPQNDLSLPPGVSFLQKPFRIRQLMEHVGAKLESHDDGRASSVPVSQASDEAGGRRPPEV